VKLTPLGKAPDSDNDGVGTPVVVTVTLPACPVWNVALEALVICGAETVKLIVTDEGVLVEPATPVDPPGA
jgi:hypothetical protein